MYHSSWTPWTVFHCLSQHKHTHTKNTLGHYSSKLYELICVSFKIRASGRKAFSLWNPQELLQFLYVLFSPAKVGVFSVKTAGYLGGIQQTDISGGVWALGSEAHVLPLFQLCILWNFTQRYYSCSFQQLWGKLLWQWQSPVTCLITVYPSGLIPDHFWLTAKQQATGHFRDVIGSVP